MGADEVQVELDDYVVVGRATGRGSQSDDVGTEIGWTEGPHEIVDVEG